MPSPFPGMDPYLENPLIWTGVHQNLITYSNEALNTVLPREYATNIGERLYVVQSDRSVYPDVAVFKKPHGGIGAGPAAVAATAITIDQPWLLLLDPVEVREPFIEILSLAGNERVVTVIEILSYTNKAPGSDGRALYLRKQREVLSIEVNLMEIDLLRGTEHLVAPPREELLAKGRWDHLVSLHRGNVSNEYSVWATTVRRRLPRIEVPLAQKDTPLAIDLQAIFERCYDAAGYARRIDYRNEPPIPLSLEDTAWADSMLRQKGYR